MTTTITTADKTELYVKDWGSGPPVILLRGWPLSADSWDDQAVAIASAGCCAIAYDRRGFGRSSQPWSSYDCDTLADDLATVIEATLECAKSFASTDFRPDLAAFKVPTLIIHGTDDQTVPIDASGRAAAKGIADSTLIEYDGAPHGLFATEKERLTRDLLAFLRE